VHLLDQAVEHLHLVAAAEKLFTHRSPDETSTARDQYRFGQNLPLSFPVQTAGRDNCK
jgi:hypothetical protein